MRKKEVATLGDDARGVFADLDAPFVKHVQGGIRFLGGGEDVEVEVVGASRLGVEAERQGAAHRVFDPRGTQHSADLYGEFRRRQLFRRFAAHLDLAAVRARLENLPAAEADAVDQIAAICFRRQGRLLALGGIHDALYAPLM